MDLELVKDRAIAVAPFARRALVVVGLVGVVWPLQYAVVVPAVYTARFLAAAISWTAKIGVVGLVLLFLPFIGWAILGIMWMNQRNHRETMAALGAIQPKDTAARANLLPPWGREFLK